jgi:mxaJ protein
MSARRVTRAVWWATAPAVVVGVLGVLAWQGRGHTRAPAARTLRVCADPNNLPFSNERREGFENALAELVARDLGARVEYAFRPQRRGFVRTSVSKGACEVVMGVPAGYERLLTTAPYYRSTYVFVYRKDLGVAIRSLDDPALRHLRIGVQVVGDDYQNTPPAVALARRGIVSNVVGYTLYGDYSKPNPAAHVVEAVAAREVDVALVWGPFAGYFAPRQKVPLEVVPVSPQVDLPFTPFVFEIAIGVKRGDTALRQELDQVLTRRRGEIAALLQRYGVPVPVADQEVAASSAPAGQPAAPAATVNTSSPPRGPERVYVTNEYGGTLSVIDTATDEVVRSIPLGGRPRGVHLSPDGRRIYVAVSQPVDRPPVEEGIVEVDASTGRIAARHPVGTDPEDFAVGARPDRLYVANEDAGTASVVELPSSRVVTTVPVGTEPEGVGITPDGRWVYVTAETSNTVSVIDTQTAEVVASFLVDSRPRRASFTVDGRLAFVSAEVGGSVSVVDVARRAIIGRYGFSRPVDRPVGVVPSSDGRWAYVAMGRAGTVAVLDLQDPRHPALAASIPVGGRPWGIGLTADGRKLYTANGSSNEVAVVDIANRKVLRKIPAGEGPWGLSIGPVPARSGRAAD